MRIGIDVGGTNTDAVLMNGATVLAATKTPTTPNVSDGITTALRTLVNDAALDVSKLDAVMIGTTHFTNAVVERRRLQPTACIRLGLPATVCLPPMVDWPEDLRAVVGNHWYLAHGGHEFDGREISPFDPAEIRQHAAAIAAKGITAIAISSVFSPVNATFEEQAAEIVKEVIPDAHVTLSSTIGRIGLLERENAAIMNACLRELAERTVNGFKKALADMQITAPFYISQNDGTLMNADFAEAYPVLTFASGPTNSMRGAAFLSGLQDAIVIDVGGTTTDVGVLQKGFPRVAGLAVDIGGVRTNFRMPDTLSIGLGGGSLVKRHPVSVGPQSVGYELTTKGLVFGGDTLTTTDICVAGGHVEIGDSSQVATLDPALVRAVEDEIEKMVNIAVDRMKTSATAVPVIVVGGGSILIQRPVAGASAVVKPEHFAVANAIGAAIAQIGGETDRIFSLAELSRDEALAQAKQEAIDKAVAAGAQPDSVEIVEVEEVPLAYLPGNATRIAVKAVGNLMEDEMRLLTEQNIEDLALGAAVLGTGGGGDPYIGMVMARQAIRDYGPVELYTLDELNDEELIVPTAMMGAPTVMIEKMPNGDDIVNAFQAVGKYIGKPIRATMSIEAGGMNSVVPIYVAARLRLPMVDCDGMGRAFPELQMVTHTIHGIAATPMAMSDERGNTVLMETINNRWTERFARSVTVDMGAMAMVALYAATVKQLKECAVIGTMTKAEEIGKTIRAARVNEADPVTTVREHVGGFLVFKGKIGDVQRRTEAGFAKGDAFLDGIDEYSGQKLQISFQNEHLVAKVDGEIKVSVPDLITVLDIDTGEPITTEAMRYGYRVAVIGIPCAHQWRTEAGLALAGPKYFGYNVEYVPVEQRYR